EALRRELAERYLAEGVSIDETAFLLRYSEASAFQRAFRRWTGLTPATYRRRYRKTRGVDVTSRAAGGSGHRRGNARWLPASSSSPSFRSWARSRVAHVPIPSIEGGAGQLLADVHVELGATARHPHVQGKHVVMLAREYLVAGPRDER